MQIGNFSASLVDSGDGFGVFVARGGSGPPVLLLHGFPETHLMWRDVAPALARDHTVLCADLPGYGRSACPPSDARHTPYAKRALARRLAEAMHRLGFDRFAVAGHDRGARVAYRMALDLPETVSRVAVLDVIPMAAAWDRADARFALAFWPFALLAQDPPLPERLIGACPEAVVDAALSGWGSPADTFPPALRAAYVEALRDPAHLHAICEEYRAAASIDREHDHADLANGRRIACPLLALWSGSGGLTHWYAAEGGPLGIWRAWAMNARGEAVPGGHFFPEEHPADTAARLRAFLTDP